MSEGQRMIAYGQNSISVILPPPSEYFPLVETFISQLSNLAIARKFDFGMS